MLVSMIWIRNYSPKILVLNPKDGDDYKSSMPTIEEIERELKGS